MEAFLDEVLNEFKDIGLNQDDLIKLIFILQDNHNKEMADISSSDAEFAIAQKDRIWNSLLCLRKFLIYSNLHYYYKEGNRSFIPLFFVVYHIFHKQITDKQVEAYFDDYDANNPEFPRIKKWINYSLVNGVFRSKGAGWIPYKTGIKKLLEKLKDYKNKDFPTTEMFKVYYDKGITFTEVIDLTKLDGFESQFMYYLIYDKNQIVRAQYIDHIMPKNILENLSYDWSKINSIKNFQLLDYGTNRGEKNGKPFKNWVDNYATDRTDYILKHLIPTDETIWTEDKFEDFIEKRAELILNKIITNLN